MPLLKAGAFDNRSDALVSIGTAIGIFGAIFGFPIIDSLTALIVAFLIIKTAVEIFGKLFKVLQMHLILMKLKRYRS